MFIISEILAYFARAWTDLYLLNTHFGHVLLNILLNAGLTAFLTEV